MSELSILISLLYPLIFVSPAYVANSSPLFFSSIVQDLHPLDFNKKFIDKERILGDGKTIEGTLFGFIMGEFYFLSLKFINDIFSITFIYYTYFDGTLLVIGALLGDILGSFIKRRLKIRRGEMLPIFDQLGFLVFALLIYSIFFSPPLNSDEVIFLLFITFFVHILTNIGAHSMKIKDKPY